MGRIFIKLLKGFLIFIGVLILIAIVFGLVLLAGWPWWMGGIVLLILAALFLGFLFIRKLWSKKREERFVHEVIAREENSRKGYGEKERKESRELADRWKEAVDALKTSHLKKQGNPLYVLPWYLIMGESGTGKTTALKSARLSSPFVEVKRTSGISGTKNCDWWFFEQAIIIDTAGRYAIPVDKGKDKDEWEKFLGLLVKYRKKEPLNGLIVTVAADKLLSSDTKKLEADGARIRSRIDELMRILMARFPVYVLVTKCDLIQGMAPFCDKLPEKSLDQAMGLLNQRSDKDVGGLVGRVVTAVRERFRHLRLLFMQKAKTGGPTDPSIMLFPEEFKRIEAGLQAFISAAFQENPYQETPILRGLYFSSGRQEGTPYSHFLNTLGLIGEKDVLPGTDRGLFLHEFFSKILPHDRRLFRPTQRALEWQRLTRNLGLSAWVALILAVSGVLSFSFIKNLSTMQTASATFTAPVVLQNNIIDDLNTLNQYRSAVQEIEEKNRNWWIPRFGLYQSVTLEEQLKDQFCVFFKRGVLQNLDSAMQTHMADFSSQTPDLEMVQAVSHLARRINLLKVRIVENSLENLMIQPQPSYAPVAYLSDRTIIPEVLDNLADLYLCYLNWQDDEIALNKEMNDLQTWLKHVLTLKAANLQWMVALENELPAKPKFLTLALFWQGADVLEKEPNVPPAFTVQGKEAIEAFLDEVQRALANPLVISKQKVRYEEWYHTAYLEAWRTFADDFDLGIKRLQGKEDWQQIINRMSTGNGPYETLLGRMSDELRIFKIEAEDTPEWIADVEEFAKIKQQAASLGSVEESGFVSQVARKGKHIVNRLGAKKIGGVPEANLENRLVSAKSYQKYRGALAELYTVAASRRIAFQVATQIFKEDPAVSKSPFFQALYALDALKANLWRTRHDDSSNIVWDLVAGPYNFIGEYVTREAACHLQQKWEEDVLVEVQGVHDQARLAQSLMAKDGLARTFVDGTAEPFISRSIHKGYYPKKVMNWQMDFRDPFLRFLQKAKLAARPTKDSYKVVIKGEPTDVNQGANVKPHAVFLTLQCGQDSQKLINLNYPVRKEFFWSPDTCGDVSLRIEVGNLILNKSYTGFRAFAKFCRDFSDGNRVFYRKEFGRDASTLKQMGISYIKVKYTLSGQQPVIKLLSDPPGRIPEAIISCWDSKN